MRSGQIAGNALSLLQDFIDKKRFMAFWTPGV